MARLEAADVDWDRPLRFRRGAAERLAGIDVYYDFDWLKHFTDRRAQFKNGLCLAKFVQDRCPEGLSPAILLTDRDNVPQGPRRTQEHFVFILNLPEYRRTHADAALSYLARRLGPDITRINELSELAHARPEELRAFLDLQLTAEHIAAWAAGHDNRVEELRGIAGVDEPTRPKADQPEVIAALRELSELDPEIVAALAALLRSDMTSETRLELLRALTDDPTGRQLTGEVLGQRISDRIADVRRATAAYAELLNDRTKGETDVQQFLEKHPWILGLDYVHMRPRKALPRGAMDFILERFDGVHDLLELKTPQDPIISAPDEVDGVPPPAHEFTLSPDLAQALAQVHVYRETLTLDAPTIERLYGLRSTRDPRVLIVIGQVRFLPSHRLEVLRDLNLSLHRVEIVPYDTLAERASTVLDNLERYLSNLDDHPGQKRS